MFKKFHNIYWWRWLCVVSALAVSFAYSGNNCSKFKKKYVSSYYKATRTRTHTYIHADCRQGAAIYSLILGETH